ncbi:hypothetical protein [Okeania sp. SIO2C9]|uniref:hypothetical protein n=1 Tax=Okeania sp. SIO2C9 TaxID=2607791 RepID=UPI0025E17C41|nr:hypothetical protein [Okeania sp. SIO2C9]
MVKPIRKHCNSGKNNDARMDRNCPRIRTRNSYTKNSVNIDIDKTGDRYFFYYNFLCYPKQELGREIPTPKIRLILS